MKIKNNDLKNISKEEVEAILGSIITSNNDPMSNEISDILKITRDTLHKTTFSYYTTDEAIQRFGDESKHYLKPNGLPCITDPIRNEVDYIGGIIRIQISMHEDFLKGIIPLEIDHLSKYVFYSFVAHSLSKLGWE